MIRPRSVDAVLLTLALAAMPPVMAENADTANKSGNPLNLAPGVNVQDYYTPKLFSTNAHTNDALIRGKLLMAANGVSGV